MAYRPDMPAPETIAAPMTKPTATIAKLVTAAATPAHDAASAPCRRAADQPASAKPGAHRNTATAGMGRSTSRAR
jgi:hypothetical protein